MADEETFDAFCLRQIHRLGAFGDFRYVGAIGRAELAHWLVRVSAGDWREKAKAIIDAALEMETLPDIVELRRVERELYPEEKSREAAWNCAYCAGTGYETFAIGGIDYARRCRCGGIPRADPQVSKEARNAPLQGEAALFLAQLGPDGKKLQ